MAVEIPRAVFEMEESLARAKNILQRLDKGQKMLKDSVENGSMPRSVDLGILFNKLALEALNELENASFMHEYLTSGRTTVLDRSGRPATAIKFKPDEHRVVDLWTLKSMRILKDVFGEENLVDFEIVP